MNRAVIVLTAFCLALGFFAPAARAAEKLTEGDIVKFIAALPETDGFFNRLRQAVLEKKESLPPPPAGENALPPYEQAVVTLKEQSPVRYGELGSIVIPHGFTSQEQWAGVADGVMKAYNAVKSAQTREKTVKTIRDSLTHAKSPLSPEATARLEKLIADIENRAGPPDENEALVRPYVTRIEGAMICPEKPAKPAFPAPSAAAP